MSSKLTKTDIFHLAKLANLVIDDNEAEKLSSELTNVFDYFEKLKEIDTSNIEPTSQTTGLTNVSREDNISEFDILTQSEALLNASKTDERYFIVERIIDRDGE